MLVRAGAIIQDRCRPIVGKKLFRKCYNLTKNLFIIHKFKLKMFGIIKRKGTFRLKEHDFVSLYCFEFSVKVFLHSSIFDQRSYNPDVRVQSNDDKIRFVSSSLSPCIGFWWSQCHFDIESYPNHNTLIHNYRASKQFCRYCVTLSFCRGSTHRHMKISK